MNSGLPNYLLCLRSRKKNKGKVRKRGRDPAGKGQRIQLPTIPETYGPSVIITLLPWPPPSVHSRGFHHPTTHPQSPSSLQPISQCRVVYPQLVSAPLHPSSHHLNRCIQPHNQPITLPSHTRSAGRCQREQHRAQTQTNVTIDSFPFFPNLPTSPSPSPSPSPPP
ncbi:hypothetical protein VTK26DRAFT_2180 [Humicola hyalothermophila]